MDPKDFVDSRSIKHYLEAIAKFPTLTEDEEKKLGEKIRQGDAEALQALVRSNLKFVVSYVKKYQGLGLGLLDLIDEGNVGLIEAAHRFDPSRSVRFVSYAVWWIRQAVLHALTQASRITHVPQKLADQISLMKRKTADLKGFLKRDPTREEIATAMGLTEPEVEDLEVLAERSLSLSDKINEDDLEVEERISDPDAPSVEYEIIKSSVRQQIREILGELDEKEALVLKWRFGLDDDRPLTLQEIGDRLDLTRERIRQIEQKAMRKLSRSQKLQHLRGYLN
ncbi:MAG TPA: RNA polymerase sigma factor RpoD/SigA [Candidatus Aminicenantes bacterium]|nr:RNA polymerase sigma factor RpoD/SigA [Candidatus Aminicenantes bacterium]HRY66264.1 RNA polymerase sigma factor RpoD/SigA [Candidatus Aminicenantes bacterium]HRZ73216.1 RNA polymerase sigma factor RpoD/SigA [Candidatus Aminicenantes bacterium]